MKCNMKCFECIYDDCVNDYVKPEYKRPPDQMRKRADYQKKLRAQRKEAGLCTRCGKREATRGILCIDCYTKDKRYKHERNYTGIVEFWKNNNLCTKCGAQRAPGHKLCERHLKIAQDGIAHAREFIKNDKFKAENKVHFARRDAWNT